MSTQTTPQTPQLQEGEKLTLLSVCRGNHTIKQVVTVTRHHDGWLGISSGKYTGTYEIPQDALVFQGDTIPYKVDSEFDCYASNYCINIVSTDDPEKIRTWIKTNNLNPYFTSWDTVRLCKAKKTTLISVYEPLFNKGHQNIAQAA